MTIKQPSCGAVRQGILRHAAPKFCNGGYYLLATLLCCCGTGGRGRGTATRAETSFDATRGNGDDASAFSGTSSPSGGTSSPSGGTSSPSGETSSPSSSSSSNVARAVIIKAGGYVNKPGPDTLSSATSEPYNSHVFADELAQQLRDLKVTTEVLSWVDCPNLTCLSRSAARSAANIVVFAGPTHDGELPRELKTLIAPLAQLSVVPRVSSVLTSCNQMPGAAKFVDELTAAGLRTVPGIAPQAAHQGSLTDPQLQAIIAAFARELVSAM